jgi:hypothetical protein
MCVHPVLSLKANLDIELSKRLEPQIDTGIVGSILAAAPAGAYKTRISNCLRPSGTFEFFFSCSRTFLAKRC